MKMIPSPIWLMIPFVTIAVAMIADRLDLFAQLDGAGGRAGARRADSPAVAVAGNDTFRAEAPTIAIDLDKAVPISLTAAMELRPERFTTTDGRTGWAVRVPGGRPIATPAYADGMLFVGGGYGSYEFYAFDARTGEKIWQIHTSDDGPSAAVVEDGYVAFNTESCTVIVVEAKTGKLVWQEWLGDPLMSQPAISKGRLYIAHPGNGRGGGSNQSTQTQAPIQGGIEGASTSHRMLCADLKTGTHIWSHPISADVISAPVVDDDKLLFTCFDGTSYCLNAETGVEIWKKENAGTSAPIVVDGKAVITRKENRDGKAYEGMQQLTLQGGDADSRTLMAAGRAEYLSVNSGGGVAIDEHQQKALDGSVGFATAPAAAQLDRANAHLGVKTVAGGWAYQGARAAQKNGQIMNAQGRWLNCVGAKSGEMAWRGEARGKGIDADGQVFSPPSLGNEDMYFTTAQGHLAAVGQKNGAIRFMYRIDHPMAFQPALADGNVYAGTADGWLICLNTGTDDADGWYAWGGNAQHNKK